MRLVTDLSITGRPHRPPRGPRDPSLELDFTASRFTLGGFGHIIQFARATTATYHDATGALQVAAIDQPRIDHGRGTGLIRGLLVENTRTNLLLNAATPATQTVSVTAALHALSFWGAGTITLSGAHSASLTGPGGDARAVLVFTPAAGALTLTVSGSVQMAQLEAGNCATSFISTAGAPATRLADRPVVLIGPWWNPDEGTVLAEWQGINQQSGNTRIIGLPGQRSILSLSAATGTGGANALRLEMWNGASGFAVILTSDITKGIRRGLAAWSSAGRQLAILGQTAVNAAPLMNSGAATEFYLGTSSASGGLAINGCLRRIRYWPRRLSQDDLLQLAT
jgi:hypothetical protein